MPDAPVIAFELCVRREAYHLVKGKMQRLEERDAALSDKPTWFQPLYGSYQKVAAAAVKANESQLRSGYLDYLFFPEVAEVVAA